MKIVIETSGVNEVMRALAGMKAKITAGLRKGFESSAMRIERDAKEEAPVNTGRLRASITSQISFKEGEYVTAEIGSNVEYAPYVELGTRPHYPPLEAIIAWVHQKGIGGSFTASGKRSGPRAFQYAEDTQTARRIANAIGRRGTKKHPYLEPAFKNNAEYVVRTISAAMREAITQGI